MFRLIMAGVIVPKSSSGRCLLSCSPSIVLLEPNVKVPLMYRPYETRLNPNRHSRRTGQIPRRLFFMVDCYDAIFSGRRSGGRLSFDEKLHTRRSRTQLMQVIITFVAFFTYEFLSLPHDIM